MIPPRTIVGVGCNPAQMASGCETLKRHGFSVVTATSVPAALAACAGIHVDAVVIGRSIPQESAETLIRRLRQHGGPPVMYLAESNRENLRDAADQQQFIDQQFLNMLRTILGTGNAKDGNAASPRASPKSIRRLQTWWLASLGMLAVVVAMVVADGPSGSFSAAGFFAGIPLCIGSAVACLRWELHAIVELQQFDIDAESWYPMIALGIAFLLPGILMEVGCFLLAMRRHLRRCR